MTLKVVSAKPQKTLTVAKPASQPSLKVVSNPNGLGTKTYNPQPVTYNPQPATYNPQPNTYNPQGKTYNPQPAATGSQVAYVTPAQFAEAARIMREEQDRINAENARIEKKKKTDAFNLEVDTKKKGFFGKLAAKTGIGSAYKQTKGRHKAAEYVIDNERVWGSQLDARKRHWEKKQGELKDWILDADSEEEWDRRQAEASKWIESEMEAINKDIAYFSKSQKELSSYAASPLNGKLPKALGATKKVIQKAVSTPFNALVWTASQPQRGINTVKNIVKPDNLRQYYTGKETKGGLNTKGSFAERVRSAYNVSRDQRIVGRSKSDTAAQLRPKSGTFMVNGKPRKVTFTPNGIEKFRVKYGDDVVDLMLDPMSWATGGAALAAKGKKITKFSAKREKLANSFAQTKVGKTFKWLNSEYKTPEAKFADAITNARQIQRGLQDEIEPQVIALDKKMNRGKRDFSVFSDLASLSEKEGAILRNMRAGKFATRDSLMMIGKKNAAFRVRLQKIAEKWEKFAEDQKIIDNVYSDQFGVGKRLYFPNTSYLKDNPKKTYDFRKRQKKGAQNVQDMYQGARDRYFASALRHNPNSNPRYEAERSALLDKYNLGVDMAKADVDKAYKGTRRLINNPIKRVGLKPTWTGFDPTLSKRAALNTTRDIVGAPMKAWRKSVLALNPAWYVNNEISAQVAMASAGGLKSIKNQFMHATSRKTRAAMNANLPDGVKSKINKETGTKLSRFASAQENRQRLIIYQTARDAGKSEQEAIKITNRWLNDYTTKNWERPIKTALPFWHWNKNLVRQSLTMPFTTPKAAKAHAEFIKQYQQRPYDALPTEKQTYTDPETGEEKTYDPRAFYKGKFSFNKGKDWTGLPMFSMNPEAIMQAGINPYLATSMDVATSKDMRDKTNTDRPLWTKLGERFPQINLGRAFTKRNEKTTRKWFAPSGSSKEKQGYDPKAPNYDKSLDNKLKFDNAKKSFIGMPRSVEFNQKEYETKKRLTNFNKDFFKVDWDKRLEELKAAQGDNYLAFDDPNNAYNILKLEQEKLASKYGFDLQKDIYDKYWSKYDTETTKNSKKLKEEAFDFGHKFWASYLSIPAGSKTSRSQRRPFLINKYDEWNRDNSFSKNGYRKIPEFSIYDKAGNKTDKKAPKNYFTLKGEQGVSDAKRASVVQHDGKFFKNAASRDRYIAGKAKWERKLAYDRKDWEYFKRNPSAARKTGYQQDGKWFKSKESADKYRRGQLWQGYFNLDSLTDRKAYLAKHPEIRTFEQPKSQEEWDAVRLLLRNRNKKNLRSLDGFTTREARLKAVATSSINASTMNLSKKYKVRFK